MNLTHQQRIVNDFHNLYYNSTHTWNNGNTKYMGIPTFQNPLDLWVLQEIIHETKPTVIVECGFYMGGLSLFLAHQLENEKIENGRVFSVDIEDRATKDHEKIIKLIGKSTAGMVVHRITNGIDENDRVMAILDSDHSTENVLKEMQIYSKLVTRGCYMIVQDSNINNPVHVSNDPGPMKAIEIFLKQNNEFEIDITKEKFYFTFCPNGWLKKRS